MRNKIIAVDFDGTLTAENCWPRIGATNYEVLNYCKAEQAKGAQIILWTNRVDKPLSDAIKWCESNGLRLDAINDNVPSSIQFFRANPRKVYADEYIDDRAITKFELPYKSNTTTCVTEGDTMEFDIKCDKDELYGALRAVLPGMTPGGTNAHSAFYAMFSKPSTACLAVAFVESKLSAFENLTVNWSGSVFKMSEESLAEYLQDWMKYIRKACHPAVSHDMVPDKFRLVSFQPGSHESKEMQKILGEIDPNWKSELCKMIVTPVWLGEESD